MEHGNVLRHCVAVLNCFDADRASLEDHISDYISDNEIEDEATQTFLIEVFSGCVRYVKVMRLVVDSFYSSDGSRCLRSERNLYTVLCYLTLYRLDELGLSHFTKFIDSQDFNKMHRFFNYFLDKESIRSWMKSEWSKIYEDEYVSTTLVKPLLRWFLHLQPIKKKLADKVANKVTVDTVSSAKTGGALKRSATVPEPFNLTQPQPRRIPTPEKIPVLTKHKPVPSTTYESPETEKQLDEIRLKNRRLAEEMLMEANRKQFACAQMEKSDKAKHKMAEIASEQEKLLDFNRSKARPPPQSMKDNIPVRLNAASILREGILFKKKEDEQTKELEHLESGARDAGEFLTWQQTMRQQDFAQELAEVERRRIEGKLSHEEAILARQTLVHDNKQRVQEMKQQASELMMQYLEQRFEDEMTMRQLVEEVMSGHKNVKKVKQQLVEYKQKLVQEVNEESKELLRQALEDAEQEMKQKIELIRQIRAMEAVPKTRQKFVNLTDTAGYGLLSEMSIAELKERLNLYKVAQEKEECDKRDEIIQSKLAKDQMLMDTLETISRHRSELSRQAALRLEDKKKNRNQKVEVKDRSVLELQEKLEQRKAERLKQTENNKIVPSRLSKQQTGSLIEQKKAREEARWKELESSRERQAQFRAGGAKPAASVFLFADQ